MRQRGEADTEELAPKEIEKRLADVAAEEEWAASTFNHYRSLRALNYRFGILNRKVTTNPPSSVMHRFEDNRRVRFLTEGEERKLREIIAKKWPAHLPELDLPLTPACGRAANAPEDGTW